MSNSFDLPSNGYIFRKYYVGNPVAGDRKLRDRYPFIDLFHANHKKTWIPNSAPSSRYNEYVHEFVHGQEIKIDNALGEHSH